MKKVLAIALSSAMVVGLLSGCGSSSTAASGTDASTATSGDAAATTATSEAAGAAETTQATGDYDVDNMTFNNVELRVEFRYTGKDTDGQSTWYYNRLDQFNKENEGKIHVTDESISTESDYEEKLTTDFASGDAPNAFLQYGGSRVKEYLDAGYLLDFTPYFNQYPDWYDGVQEFAWETCKYDGYDGTYGIPWSSYQLNMFYNKDLLNKAGVDVPQSWDDLVDACAKLKAAGIQPFNYSDKDNYHYEHLMSEMALKAYGTDIAGNLADGTETYDGEKMVKIYQLMKDMIDAGYWGDAILSTDVATERSMFESGQAAFFIDGTWNCGNFINDSDTSLFDAQTIGVTRVPYIDEAYQYTEMGGGSDTYYITTLNKSDEEIAATVKFIKYLTTVDAINEMCQSSPTTYAEKVTIDTGNYLLDEVNKIMAENQGSKLELPNYSSNTAAMDTIRNSLQALATGSAAQDVGSDIVDKMAAYE